MYFGCLLLLAAAWVIAFDKRSFGKTFGPAIFTCFLTDSPSNLQLLPSVGVERYTWYYVEDLDCNDNDDMRKLIIDSGLNKEQDKMR